MIVEQLELIINNIFKECGYDEKISIKKSNRPELCDYQCDDLFRIAKNYHQNPILIGDKIVEEINNIKYFNNWFEEVVFAKPGFINIKINDKLINDTIKKMNDNKKFNMKEPEKKELYFLDYGGPNIAKPLHVGHLRTAILGESIKRIINYVGHNTISDVHLGDYGLQIGQVIYGMKNENIDPDNITLEQLNYLYPKYSKLCKEDEELKERCAFITKQLQDGNEEYYNYYKKIKEISISDIKSIYDYLSVKFDLWYGEIDSKKYIDSLEKILVEKKLLQNSEGALVIDIKKTTDKKELPPLIFKKSNGAYLYGSTDMATIYQREIDYHPNYILYVTDLRQSLHFNQVFRATKKVMITPAKLEHLGYGTINGIDGKPYKTRSGNTPKLSELFEEVKQNFKNIKEDNKNMSDSDVDKIVNAIIKFADLQNNREKDYIFDIKKFSEVVGKTGPYILYTYLRINKILKNEQFNNELSSNIYNKSDRDLRFKITELEQAINQAFLNRMPSYIADYIYELCVLTNTFYQNNHIAKLEDKTKKNDWLYVLSLTRNILKELFDLLIIDIPTVM